MKNNSFVCFILFSLYSVFVYSQQVVPLMRDNSFKTHVSLPFRLQDNNSNPMTVINTVIANPNTSCLTMLDPNISSNFLVKCVNSETISVSVYFQNNSKIYKILYGPFNVTKLSANAVVPTAPPVVGNVAVGKNLFNQLCLSCHQFPQDKAGRSSSKIQAAITGIGQMNYLSTLSASEIKSISDYLNSL